MDDIVVRAMKALDDLSTYDAAPLWDIVEELVDTLQDERRDCRILEAIINDLRAAEEWVNGKSQ